MNNSNRKEKLTHISVQCLFDTYEWSLVMNSYNLVGLMTPTYLGKFPLWLILVIIVGSLCLLFYLWHLYNQRQEANLRDKVKSILFEYLPSDDYNYVEMEMEDRSYSPVTRPLLVPQIV